MINNVVLMGRAGRDPESKSFTSGATVTELTMAINRPKKDKDKQETDWITVKFWGQPGEVARDYLKKGDLFALTGSIQQESWEATEEKDGKKITVKRSKLIVKGHRLQLMPKGTRSEEQEPATEKSEEELTLDAIFGGSE